MEGKDEKIVTFLSASHFLVFIVTYADSGTSDSKQPNRCQTGRKESCSFSATDRCIFPIMSRRVLAELGARSAKPHVPKGTERLGWEAALGCRFVSVPPSQFMC